MSATKITATEASRNFSDVLNRVEYQGESFVIERNGRVIGRLEPEKSYPTGEELARALAQLPKPDPEFWKDLQDIHENQPPLPEPPEW